MALVLDNEEKEVLVNVNTKKMTQLIIDTASNMLVIMYDNGSTDAEGNFTKISSKQILKQGTDYGAVVMSNPQLYGAIQQAVYDIIKAEEGITGTIV